ncbi:MAG TPA: 50S ribosomal protein L30e [Candidatus Thermoplasmatota archaeon]|nr:50S ribosomal protein L30e [Candidatus Thermoplasmatota archaeon]
MDINRALRSAASTGKVTLGQKESAKVIEAKQAKLVVLASNIPAEDAEKLTSAAQKAGVPVYRFSGPNTELGPACGKPFPVSTMAVVDAGESDVLALAKLK